MGRRNWEKQMKMKDCSTSLKLRNTDVGSAEEGRLHQDKHPSCTPRGLQGKFECLSPWRIPSSSFLLPSPPSPLPYPAFILRYMNQAAQGSVLPAFLRIDFLKDSSIRSQSGGPSFPDMDPPGLSCFDPFSSSGQPSDHLWSFLRFIDASRVQQLRIFGG